MKTPLAWLNLWHDKTRTAVAVAGVAFAVVLILMQLGFFQSVERTATEIYDQLEFDLLLTSQSYFYVSKPGDFPRTRLFQVLEEPRVVDVRPLYLGFNYWLNNGVSEAAPSRRGIFVIGFNLEQPVFRLLRLRGDLSPLKEKGHVFMDTFSSRKHFGDWEHSHNLEVGGRKIEVVGKFSMGTGFGADGDLIVSDQTFAEMFPGRPLSQVSLGLIRVERGSDVNETARRLRARLPPDVDVLTRAEIERHERKHWVQKTSVGVIFAFGVTVGFLVGTAIVYQVLASDITNHLAEYATLKAMGYAPRYLNLVILQQALILAVAGFLPGWAISRTLYWFTRENAHVPMDLTWRLSLWMLLLCVIMCALSGVLSLRKVNRADPADLF